MTKNNYLEIGEALSNAEFKGVVITKLGYIEEAVETNKVNIKVLCGENQQRKDWQENYDVRIRTLIGVASFVGGCIVFLVDRMGDIIDWFKGS